MDRKARSSSLSSKLRKLLRAPKGEREVMTVKSISRREISPTIVLLSSLFRLLFSTLLGGRAVRWKEERSPPLSLAPFPQKSISCGPLSLSPHSLSDPSIGVSRPSYRCSASSLLLETPNFGSCSSFSKDGAYNFSKNRLE